MADTDPFRVLDLPYDADAEAVRRVFRVRARETHPDRGGSAEAFHAVRVAYGALTRDLDGERRRWRPAARAASARFPGGLDPRLYPTCPVTVGRSRDGTPSVTYEVDARPEAWRPGATPPPGGTCQERHDASDAFPAFGVWTVPLDAHRYRCVFGPHPEAASS